MRTRQFPRPREPSLLRDSFRSISLSIAVAFLTPAAIAQPAFSIDWHGPPIGVPDPCWGVPITEGDILVPAFFQPARKGPLPPPCVAISAGMGPPMPGLMLPAHAATLGHPAGVMGMVEVDALSFGTDYAPKPTITHTYVDWHFSVDDFATGIPNTPTPPAVWNAGAIGVLEAAADMFVDVGRGGAFSPCPLGAITGNTSSLDGDGLAAFGSPGVGLIEPSPPAPGPFAPGSNLDAVDVDTVLMPGMPVTVYYSLDSGFIDPLRGVPNSNSAATLAAPPVVGGDVLVTTVPGGMPMVFAPAPMLGLDLFGPGTDDLDALVLWENGTGVFEPPIGAYSWVSGQTDAIFFSVRRGSALVMNRVLDSRCGLPIEEGDILIPPFVQGLPPAIWIHADVLGLATVRSGTALVPFGDDLDALDLTCQLPADIDSDGDVDLSDLSRLLANFGTQSGATFQMGDVDGDGDVDLTDLSRLLTLFGLRC